MALVCIHSLIKWTDSSTFIRSLRPITAIMFSPASISLTLKQYGVSNARQKKIGLLFQTKLMVKRNRKKLWLCLGLSVVEQLKFSKNRQTRFLKARNK